MWIAILVIAIFWILLKKESINLLYLWGKQFSTILMVKSRLYGSLSFVFIPAIVFAVCLEFLSQKKKPWITPEGSATGKIIEHVKNARVER